MSDEGFSMIASTPEEHIQLLQGRIHGLEVALIGVMRVVTSDVRGEPAYQALAQLLQLEANTWKAAPGKIGEGASFQLAHLAGVFAQPPRN